MNETIEIGIIEVQEDHVLGWRETPENPCCFDRDFVDRAFACKFPVGKIEEPLSVHIESGKVEYSSLSRPAMRDYSLEEVEALESNLLSSADFVHVDCPLVHRFAPGVYYREIFMPKGIFVIGHCHKTEHLNVITEGRATVMFDGQVHEIMAPCVIKSGVNVRKVLYIHESMRWATIHPTEETDLQKLEELLITKSDSWLLHQSARELESLKLQIEQKGGI